MRMSLVFCLLVPQTSALFYGAISGALGSVKSSVGKFFSDVGNDLLDTYDCTVHEIEKVFYNENQISEYYNKCKENEAQENNLITAEKIETQKSITLIFKSDSERTKGSAATNESLTKKLESVEALLKEQYERVNNLTTNLDHELKSLSKNVDVELKKIENEREVAMEKCLHKIENEFRLYKETNNKDNKDEILRVLEEILKLLNKYTNQKDSELKNQMKDLVAAMERNSTYTILEDLEKWKEKVIQQTKDVSNDRGRNFTSISKNVPQSFKELFMKISNETADSNVKNNGNKLGSIETATIVKVFAPGNEKPMKGSTIIIQKNETIENIRAITKLEININSRPLSSFDVEKEVNRNETHNKEKPKSISSEVVTKNQTADLVESTFKQNCTEVTEKPLSTLLVSVKKSENITDHQELSSLSSPSSNNELTKPSATYNISTKDSTESPLSTTPINVQIMKHPKPSTSTLITSISNHTTDHNTVETTMSPTISNNSQTTKSASPEIPITDTQQATEPPILTITKIFSATNVVTHDPMTTITLPTTLNNKLITEKPIVSTTASTLSTILQNNGEATVLPTISSTIKDNEITTKKPALPTSTPANNNNQIIEKSGVSVDIDSKQTTESSVESATISTTIDVGKLITEKPILPSTASTLSTILLKNEETTVALLMSTLSSTVKYNEKTTARPILPTSTTATSINQTTEHSGGSATASTTLNSKLVTEKPLVSTTASTLSTVLPKNGEATVVPTISSTIEKTTKLPELPSLTPATNNNQTKDQSGVSVDIDSKHTTESPVESVTIPTTINLVIEKPLLPTTASTLSTVIRKNGETTIVPTIYSTMMNNEKTTARSALSTSTNPKRETQTTEQSGVFIAIDFKQNPDGPVESATNSTTLNSKPITEKPKVSATVSTLTTVLSKHGEAIVVPVMSSTINNIAETTALSVPSSPTATSNDQTTQQFEVSVAIDSKETTESLIESATISTTTDQPVVSISSSAVDHTRTTQMVGSIHYSNLKTDKTTTKHVASTTLLPIETSNTLEKNNIPDSLSYSTQAYDKQGTAQPPVLTTLSSSVANSSEATTGIVLESSQFSINSSYEQVIEQPGATTTSSTYSEQITNKTKELLELTNSKSKNYISGEPAVSTTVSYSISNNKHATDLMKPTLSIYPNNNDHTTENMASATPENVLESPLTTTQFNYNQILELPVKTKEFSISRTLSSTGLEEGLGESSILANQTISETDDRSTAYPVPDNITDSSLLFNLYNAQTTKPKLSTVIDAQLRHKSISDKVLITEKTLSITSSNESVPSINQSLEAVPPITNKDLPSIVSSLDSKEQPADQTSMISSGNNEGQVTDQSLESMTSLIDTDLPTYQTSIKKSQCNESKPFDQSIESKTLFTKDEQRSNELSSNNPASSVADEEQKTQQYPEPRVSSSVIEKQTSSLTNQNLEAPSSITYYDKQISPYLTDPEHTPEEHKTTSLKDDQQISYFKRDDGHPSSSLLNNEQMLSSLKDKERAPSSMIDEEQSTYLKDEQQKPSSLPNNEPTSTAIMYEEETLPSLRDYEQPSTLLDKEQTSSPIKYDEQTSSALIVEEQKSPITNDEQSSSALIDEEQTSSITNDEQTNSALMDEEQTFSITNDEQSSSALIDEDQTSSITNDEQSTSALIDEEQTSSITNDEQSTSALIDEEQTSSITDDEQSTSALIDEDQMSSITNDEQSTSALIDKEQTSSITNDEQSTSALIDEEQTSSITDDEQSTSALIDEDQMSSITNDEQSTSALIDEEQTSSITNDEQSTSALIDEEQTSSITNDEQSASAFIDEEQTITNDKETLPALVEEEQTSSITNDEQSSSALIDEEQTSSLTNDEQSLSALMDEEQTSSLTNDEQSSSALTDKEQTSDVTDEKQIASTYYNEQATSYLPNHLKASSRDEEQITSSLADEEETSSPLRDAEQTSTSMTDGEQISSIRDDHGQTSNITDEEETMYRSSKETDNLSDRSLEPLSSPLRINEQQTSHKKETKDQSIEPNKPVSNKELAIDQSSEAIISSSLTNEEEVEDKLSESIISSTSMVKGEHTPDQSLESAEFSKLAQKNGRVSVDSEIVSFNKTAYQHTTNTYEQTKHVESSSSVTNNNQKTKRVIKTKAASKPEYRNTARKSALGSGAPAPYLKNYGKWLNEFPISDKIATDEAKRLIDESIKAKTIMDNIFSDTNEATNLFDNPDYMK